VNLFSFFRNNKIRSYTCSCCGKAFDSLPLCFGAEYPDYYFSIPADEIGLRVEYSTSWCVVDNEHFFHRGRLTIPIIDHNENLIFNVWTSISEENFGIRMELWNDPNRINQQPYFGWLQTFVPTYGDTLNLKTIAIEQGIDLIPEIKMIEEDHPLTTDQEKGITYKRAVEIVDEILKKEHCKLT
jgi:hypothetical protein